MSFDVPVILLKNLVILPNQEIKLALNNEFSGKIINEARNNYKSEVLVVTPTDTLEEEPSVSDLPSVGVVAKIKNKIDKDDEIIVKLRGYKRVIINKYYQKNKNELLYSKVTYPSSEDFDQEEVDVILKKLIKTLKEYINLQKSASNDILNFVVGNDNLDIITDSITSYLQLDIKKRLEYMEEVNPIKRATSLIRDLNEEIISLKIDEEIESCVDDALKEEQRLYVLREKDKAIKKLLGETSYKACEVEEYKSILNKLKIDKKIKNHINKEIEKYELIPDNSQEVGFIRNYLEWILNLPWNKTKKESANFNLVSKHLDETHFGLEKIKQRISEYVAIKNLNQNINPPIICLVGPPGVGKTTIARSISSALGRDFCKISVGGLNDSLELVGSRRTYLASSPGAIIREISKCGSNNPVMLIDEVDKMVKDYKGDPAATLLEILDSKENYKFMDNYLEEPFDLSKVLFILTANNKENIPKPLLDRVEVINLNSYTIFEKKDIAKNYMLPNILKENVVYDSKIKFSDELICFIIKNYTKESGVRDLERVLSQLARKITINNVKILNEERVKKLLGEPPYKDIEEFTFSPGVVNTLAVGSIGGEVSICESVVTKGNGKITITGNSGDILKESVSVVLTMLKQKYKYNFHNEDMHIHFLDATTKKDGPSAGVSIAAAICSIKENKVIPPNIAFSGELSLNGNILKIGGLKEKLIAAYNKNIDTVFIPKDNSIDLEIIPSEVKEKIKIILVSNFSEVYKELFK